MPVFLLVFVGSKLLRLRAILHATIFFRCSNWANIFDLSSEYMENTGTSVSHVDYLVTLAQGADDWLFYGQKSIQHFMNSTLWDLLSRIFKMIFEIIAWIVLVRYPLGLKPQTILIGRSSNLLAISAENIVKSEDCPLGFTELCRKLSSMWKNRCVGCATISKTINMNWKHLAPAWNAFIVLWNSMLRRCESVVGMYF